MAKQNKSSQALSPIEKKLLDYCKTRQPVLLYGNLPGNVLEDLIDRVHKIYVDVYVKNNENYHWKRIDCGAMNGEAVYEKLVGERNGVLFNCDGLVIVENCNSKNNNDEDNYDKIAKIIREHCDKHKNKHGGIYRLVNGKRLALSFTSFFPRILVAPLIPTIFKWLVVYASDPNGFSNYFIKRFEPIPLCSEDEKKIEGFAEFRSTPQTKEYEFILNGEYWKITYEGKTKNFNNSIGLQYIHYLLEKFDKDLTPTMLVSEMSKASPEAYRKLGEQQERKSTEDDSVKKRPDGIPFGQVLTDEAREELKERYDKLKSDLKDDLEIKCDEEVVEIEEEMTQIMETLKASIDKDGKSRNFADIVERNRRSVSKAIDESLNKIKDEKNGLPALGRHFDITLKSGTSCSYKPEKPIPWKL